MALLKRDDVTFPLDEVHTILGPEATFDGKLVFDGTVRVDGKFSGEVRSDGELVVGASARLEALVVVGSIVVIGEIRGDIQAARSVEIQATGKVWGNITTPQLSIAKGAAFEGACRMHTNGTQPPGGLAEASAGAEAARQ